MAAFAKLTEAQRERLEMLVEEAGEIVAIGTKILRHGYQTVDRTDEPPTSYDNEALLDREITDLLTVANRMVCEGDLTGDFHCADLNAAWKRKLRYTHHQRGQDDG